MRFEVVTIFPELIEAFAGVGLVGKACDAGRIGIASMSPRELTTDRHQTVDDAPYGGGSGMVMRPDPIAGAMDVFDQRASEAGAPPARRILLSPQGAPLTQETVRRLAREPALMLVCGRYEGFDERLRSLVQEELSVGDFVVQGGEVAAMTVIEAVSRYAPGVLGNEASLDEESHAAGLLEYPHYTRPRTFRGVEVPEVLLGGNHAAIARWRRREALRRTRERRPDLFAKLVLSDEDRALLDDQES